MKRLPWLDPLKGIAILWIFGVHATEQVFGGISWCNPSQDWPTLTGHLDQLAPLEGHGVWDIGLNLVRYLGWMGDQGVSLFLVASGFGLVWGLKRRGSTDTLDHWDFFRRRTARIYPTWWAAHAGLLAFGWLTGFGMSPTDGALLPSLLGFRATPGTYYYGVPAWWYVGLLIQLYLLFPWLWGFLRTRGPGRFLLVTCVGALVLRAAGLFLLWGDPYVDPWSRGAVFVARLPEFAFGMALAWWLAEEPSGNGRRLASPAVVAASLVLFVAGNVAGLFALGLVVAPFLQGASGFLILYAVLEKLTRHRDFGPLAWLGRHSYAFYLVHQLLIYLVLPPGSPVTWAAVGVPLAALLSIPVALGLESVTGLATRRFREKGVRGLLLGLGLAALVLGVTAILADSVVRKVDPQEVEGWGERSSLEPHPEFDWRLKPGVDARLRWEGYDYRVRANSLGFPGPEPRSEGPASWFRILVTGDAFSSAEGVDTPGSWPRLLEAGLRERVPDLDTEVINLSITGYGPNQYAAVLESMVPRFEPDLVIVELFVNDFGDALTSGREFQDSIGFQRRDPDGLSARIRPFHLRRILALKVWDPLARAMTGKAQSRGRFMGHLDTLLSGPGTIVDRGSTVLAERLERIREVARGVDARVLVVMVPSSVQVCRGSDLDYVPDVAIPDGEGRYQVDRPQEAARRITSDLGLAFYDLREPLNLPRGGCHYHRFNMHWLPSGHEAVAGYLSGRLQEDGYLTPFLGL